MANEDVPQWMQEWADWVVRTETHHLARLARPAMWVCLHKRFTCNVDHPCSRACHFIERRP